MSKRAEDSTAGEARSSAETLATPRSPPRASAEEKAKAPVRNPSAPQGPSSGKVLPYDINAPPPDQNENQPGDLEGHDDDRTLDISGALFRNTNGDFEVHAGEVVRAAEWSWRMWLPYPAPRASYDYVGHMVVKSLHNAEKFATDEPYRNQLTYEWLQKHQPELVLCGEGMMQDAPPAAGPSRRVDADATRSHDREAPTRSGDSNAGSTRSKRSREGSVGSDGGSAAGTQQRAGGASGGGGGDGDGGGDSDGGDDGDPPPPKKQKRENGEGKPKKKVKKDETPAERQVRKAKRAAEKAKAEEESARKALEEQKDKEEKERKRKERKDKKKKDKKLVPATPDPDAELPYAVDMRSARPYDPSAPDAIPIPEQIKALFTIRLPPPLAAFHPDNLKRLNALAHLHVRTIKTIEVTDFNATELRFAVDGSGMDRDQFMAAIPNLIRALEGTVVGPQGLSWVAHPSAINPVKAAANILNNHMDAGSQRKWPRMLTFFLEFFRETFSCDPNTLTAWEALRFEMILTARANAEPFNEGGGASGSKGKGGKEDGKYGKKEEGKGGKYEEKARTQGRDKGDQRDDRNTFRPGPISEGGLICFSCARAGHKPSTCRHDKQIDGREKLVIGTEGKGLTLKKGSGTFCISFNRGGNDPSQGGCANGHENSREHRCAFCGSEDHWADSRKCIGRSVD
ncbi:hypothetical protein PENSPDRAFT_693760 [Peniophora sp. CONT]|nr:hypothetical protein PENSPDRAFT_693760 [Peniophora sp. CONT]